MQRQRAAPYARAERRKSLVICTLLWVWFDGHATNRQWECGVHGTPKILVVCGARKGFRFNSQDITAFRTLSEQLAAQFDRLDQIFQTLSLDVTQYKFADLKRIEDDAPFFRYVTTSSCDTTELPPELFCSHSKSKEEHTDAAIRWRAMVFQWRARQYIDSFSRLRETILGIRERLQLYISSRKLLVKTKDLGDAGTVQVVLSAVCLSAY